MTKPISDKQLAANQANAKKSSGPSEEGKKRSSRNALKTGTWAKGLDPIPAGPFRERRDRFQARVKEIIDGFEPRDTLEAVMAKQAAAAVIRLERADRYEAALLLEAAGLNEALASLYLDPDDVSEERCRLAELTDQVDIIAGSREIGDMKGYDPYDDDAPWWFPGWERTARLLRRFSPDPKAGVKDLWTDEKEPGDDDEWKKATKSLFRHHWEGEVDCRARLWIKDGELIRLEEKSRAKWDATIARQSIAATTKQVDRPRTAAWTDFNRAYSALLMLKKRDLPEAS